MKILIVLKIQCKIKLLIKDFNIINQWYFGYY